MRVAIPISEGRISPVFDAAKRLVLVDVDHGREVRRTEEGLEEPEMVPRARRVAEFGVDLLICGAISRPLQAMLLSEGVEVVSQTCGQAEEVIRAFVSGQLTEHAFLVPGCCGRRSRFRGSRSRDGQERNPGEGFIS